MRLIDCARVLRSKNAGPLHLTLDLMFPDEESFSHARDSRSLSPAAIAALYGVQAEAVSVIPFPAAFAIKIVMDRPIVAGTPGDRDVYGAQQHGPLLEVVL